MCFDFIPPRFFLNALLTPQSLSLSLYIYIYIYKEMFSSQQNDLYNAAGMIST